MKFDRIPSPEKFTIILNQSSLFLSCTCLFPAILLVSLDLLFIFNVDIAVSAHFLCIDGSVNVRTISSLSRLVLPSVRMVALVAHATRVVLGIGVGTGCSLFETHLLAVLRCG